MMTHLWDIREDLHYRVGDGETKISDDRFVDVKESFLVSSYFLELCLFRGRFWAAINPNNVKKQVSEDILTILSSLSNRQEIFTLVWVSQRI
jgi:hypothetical protein